MNCIERAALKSAIAAVMTMAASGASAQAFTRGELVWNDTATAVVGTAQCLGCHMVTAPIATIRNRYSALTQGQVSTRIDMAFAGMSGSGAATPMAGVYPGNTITSIDRNALTLYLGNFIGIPTAAAAPTLLNALTAAAGANASTTLTITNSGRSALTFAAAGGFVFSGANAGDFSRMAVGTGCDTQTVAAAANCQETIRFAPPAGATGARTATLTITHNGSPTTSVLALSGTVGAAPPPPSGGALPSGGSDSGGAVWPWSLLLLGAVALRRRPR